MAEAQQYVLSELYGGAMTVELPEGMADVSDLCQVPDHQEVFAHSVQPFSIIIELAERVKPDDLADDTSSNDVDADAEEDADADRKSALFHLEEICRLGGDTYEILEEIHRVKVDRIPGAAAFAGEARFRSGSRPVQSAATVAGVRGALSQSSDVTRFLLVRLKEQETDVVVTMTLDEAGSPEEAEKLRMKSAAFMKRIRETLQIHDWKLFG
ncbi:hypothetical protein KEM54_001911 [Ascosphaera aggregata]|nr:hypothetical protein KEM54_001911 [Ascosphaera aggregata]